MRPSRIQYVSSQGYDIAWHDFGHGDELILMIWSAPNHLDSLWEWPSIATFLRGLGELARVAQYDHRGTGLSSRVSSENLASPSEHAKDAIAVMDAAGMDRAVVMADSTSTATAVEVALLAPERVSRLVLMNPAFHGIVSDEDAEFALEFVEQNWGKPLLLHAHFPSLADDPRFVEWWCQHLRRSATPSTARAMVEMDFMIDARPRLKHLSLPVLILLQQGDRALPDDVPELAAQIPDHAIVHTPGYDHVYGAGPGDAEALAAVAAFLDPATGASGSPDRTDRAILFTDIVDSTTIVSRVGDDAWRQLIDQHDRATAQSVKAAGGQLIKSTGDGYVATFDSADAALTATVDLHHRLQQLGLQIRAGIHYGSVEIRGDDITGLNVNIAARVGDLAPDGSVLITGATAHMLNSSAALVDHGLRTLKGVPDSHQLYEIEVGEI